MMRPALLTRAGLLVRDTGQPIDEGPESGGRHYYPERDIADPAEPIAQSVNIPHDVHAAERRRTQRFMDDEWGNPQDHPLRYPRG